MKNHQMLFVLALLMLIGAIVNTVSAVETVIFNDNFNDGSIVDWDSNSGTWSGATFALVGPGADNQSISHTISLLNDGASKRIYFKMIIVGPATEGEFAYFTDRNGVFNSAGTSDINGYVIRMTGANLTLQRFINGSATNLINGTNPSGYGTYVDVNITHGFDGNIQLWVNGLSQGSVIDSTYNRGNRIIFGTNQGPTINVDDLNILFTGDNNTMFRVVDEETSGSGLPNAIMTINGVPWPVSSTGTFDVNAGVTFPATFVISKTGYDTRTFVFDTNAGLYKYRLLGLRTANESQDISFIFYDEDEATKLTDRYISVTRGTVLSGHYKTTSNAGVTFNLAPQDGNYLFNIFSGTTDVNIVKTYTAVTVTVNQPKNEVTNASITPNSFILDVGGLGLQSYPAQALPMSSIIILGNTNEVYSLRVVDNNADGQQFFSRYYVMLTKGDVNTLTIQPYLISATQGILVNIKAVDLPTNISTQDIRVRLSKPINGTLTTVEDRMTNILGIAQVVMVSQQDYTIDVTSPNGDINYFTGTTSPTTQTATIVINISSQSISYGQKQINYSITPIGDKIIATGTGTQQIDFNVSANYDLNSIMVQAIDINNVVRNMVVSASNPFNSFITLTLSQFDSNWVRIVVTVSGDDQNIVIPKTYLIVGSTGNSGAIGFRGLELSDLSLASIVIIIMIGSVFFLGSSPTGNNNAQVFPVAIIGSAAFYILLPGYFLYFMGALVAGGIAWMWTRSSQ